MLPRKHTLLAAFLLASLPSISIANDLCVDAIDLGIVNGTVTVLGDTTNATVDSDIPACDGIAHTAPGLWYKFTTSSIRREQYTVSTCHSATTFDTKLSVFQGECDNSVCIDGQDDGTGCLVTTELFLDCLQADTQYSVLVHGFGRAAGSFTLTVEEGSQPCNLASPPPPNDDCSQSQSLMIGGPPAIGTTVGATAQARPNDVFYRVVGNGRTLQITTCSTTTTTPHNLLVLNGGCSLMPLGEVLQPDSMWCDNLNASTFVFDSLPGRNYPIAVYPRVDGQEGNFSIQVTDWVNPPNDYCEMAQPLEIDGPPVEGTTVNATAETVPDDVVFAVLGTGAELTVTTCFPDTQIPTSILLRNGSCTAAAFGASSRDPSCSLLNGARTTWNSVANVIYPIVVYPREAGAEGTFQIRVRDTSTITSAPTAQPTTSAPTTQPSLLPSAFPSTGPPSGQPTAMPSNLPTTTQQPTTSEPSVMPTELPTITTTSNMPTSSPSVSSSSRGWLDGWLWMALWFATSTLLV